MDKQVKVEDLTPDMVYLRDGAQMLVLEAGENVPLEGPPHQTYFVVGRCLADWEAIDNHMSVGKGTEFRVVDARAAVYDACMDLGRMIRRCEAVLNALSAADHAARMGPARELAEHKATLREVQQVANRLGVRCRG